MEEEQDAVATEPQRPEAPDADPSDLPGEATVDASILDALSTSSRRALEVANRFRVARRRRDIHMEHLLVGLFQKPRGPTHTAFARANIDSVTLARTLGTSGFDAPAPEELDGDGGWPATDEPLRFSRHVADALEQAASGARRRGSELIRSRHLLEGFFQVNCRVVKPFHDVVPHVLAVVDELEREENEPKAAVGKGSAAGNDRVAQEDQLGFVHYVNAFADLIEAPQTQPPLTIGIFGSWGMGKSFLLKHIARELKSRQDPPQRVFARLRKPARARGDERPSIHVVRFNAWEYNATDRIWPGLVRKVMDEVDRRLSWWSWPPRLGTRRAYRKVRRNFVGTLRAHWGHLVVFAGAAAVLAYLLRPYLSRLPLLAGLNTPDDFKLAAAVVGAVAAVLSLVVGTLLTPLGNWVAAVAGSRQRYGTAIDYMSDIRDDLRLLDLRLRNGAPAEDSDDDGFASDARRKAARERAKKHRARPGRVLIVIDDLDRCEPDKAVEVLQSINLLLNFDSFIVCIGIDARVITGAVEKHYQDLLGPAGISGYEYLDKIIQIPFRIPEPSEDDLEDFLAQQLRPGSPSRTQTPLGSPGEPAQGQASTPPAAADGAAQPPEAERQSTFPAPRWFGVFGGRRGPSVKEVPGRSASDAPAKAPAPGLEPRFSDDEVTAFRAMTPFLRSNPRHVKRMVNVYVVVRSLRARQRPAEPLPAGALVRWLVTCGQWPYTCHHLLERFDEIDRDRTKRAQVQTLYEEFHDDPLGELYRVWKPKLDGARLQKLDYDLDVLERLLAVEEGRLSWDELKTLRQYTINFNPAVESELTAATTAT
jgi:Cdc6-like AAA superfamily ATPase